MNRLQTEFRRLFLFPGAQAAAGPDNGPSGLVDGQAGVRAMVLELARPADWDRLSKVWSGVQTDLNLPAPAIAVSGTDGLQLWFSLSEPLGPAQAHEFLESLRERYLADVPPHRVRLMPAAGTAATTATAGLPAEGVPALQTSTGNWSAFVAPGLAPLFTETPWLDMPPSEEGQANLLSGLDSIKRSVFEAAFERLGPATEPRMTDPSPAEPVSDAQPTRPAAAEPDDPKRFLLAVMNDGAAPLALRVEAAKALLPYPVGGPSQKPA